MILGVHILDDGLNLLSTQSDRLCLLTDLPSDYTDVLNFTSAYKSFGAGSMFDTPVDAAPNGRKVVAPAITDGLVLVDGPVLYWAVITTYLSRLDACGPLPGRLFLSAGIPFVLNGLEIRVPSQ